MNKKTASELLQDVLKEPQAFQSALLKKTLHAARRRKQTRQMGWSCLTMMAIIALTVCFWPKNSPSHFDMAKQTSYIIHSEPIFKNQIVATRPFNGIIHTVTNSILIVRTSKPDFKMINDKELLASLIGYPAILVKKIGGIRSGVCQPSQKRLSSFQYFASVAKNEWFNNVHLTRFT